MNKISKVVVLLLVGILALSACKVQTITPPVTPTTEVPTAQASDATGEAVVPDLSATPAPTPDTRLTGDDGLMVCFPSTPFFPELTEAQKQELSIFPAPTGNDWVKGAESPTLVLTEYTDFQCPYCSMFAKEADTLIKQFPNDVQLVYHPLPLTSIHPNANLAAQAAEAAGRQGKFWEMYHELFTRQEEWSSLATAEFELWLIETGTKLGLDATRLGVDMKSEEIRSKIAIETATMNDIGVNSTPTILLNGRPWQYDWSAATLAMVLKVMKSEKGLDYKCPPFEIDQNKKYTATITTEHGEMVFELYPKQSPIAVNSFVYLARKGFYNGLSFHRVIKDFMAQTGDPSGTGMSGAGYEFREEVNNGLNFSEPYMLGVANTGQPNSSGSQFFITFAATEWLNDKHTVFGKLISGQDVLAKITERDPQQNPDFEGDLIISITIEEK